ncbi:MAG: hypothetical protein IK044_08465 [Methanobrevibacter sp.]|nr:hypothetical protein [Methanobrevibacter sp.]
MNKLKIFLVFFVLLISIGAVSAEGNFTSLQTDIADSADSIDIAQDYTFDEKSDVELTTGIVINKTNFVINGNGHTLDGNGMSRIFDVNGENITINNLNFINGKGNIGGAIVADAKDTVINNCTFNGNNATTDGGAIVFRNTGSVINSLFTDNYSPDSGAIGVYQSEVLVNTSTFTSSIDLEKGFIHGAEASIIVQNSIFKDTVSKYAAIISDRVTVVENSKFINLKAKESGGAIIIKELDNAVIYGCSFINVSSEKNAGAVLIDVKGFIYNDNGTARIRESEFVNCSSEFGGAVVILGGYADIINCEFKDNKAEYDGGALYASNNELTILNTLFNNNKLTSSNENLTHGGAIYMDASDADINNTHFINNDKHAIYAYATNINVSALFINNTEAFHGTFLGNYEVNYNPNTTDIFVFNDTDYATFIIEEGAKIELLNSTIIMTNLPSKFNAKDWGWVSSVKDQGDDNSCWTFGTASALESALLKATGVEYDFSENNIQNSMLRYSKYGNKYASEGGSNILAAAYVLNWFGMLPTEDDTYDEYGKIPLLISSTDNIHVQDAIIIPKRESFTDNNVIKRALIEHGALSATIKSVNKEPYYNKKTAAQYYNNASDTNTNHIVTLVGWDDSYSKDNFLITPPGNGAWIIKNSYGTSYGDEGYNYVSYYDVSFLFQDSMGYIFENTEQYDTNYQYDLGGEIVFISKNNTDNIYKNVFTAVEDTYISAFGSWFEQNKPYTYEIYVNNELRLSGSGKSAYTGYHTIILSEYISIDENDEFCVILNNSMIPLLRNSRQFFEANHSFIYGNTTWEDLSESNVTACIKVYTQKAIADLKTQDLVKYYKNDTQFTADIGTSGKTVTFEINGNKYTRTSNAQGIATMSINLNPGDYTIKTEYNGKILQNDIEVLPTLIGNNLVKYFRNDSQFFIKLIDGQGNPVSGKNITMNINGVFYNRATNENGIARLNINLIPGTYILTALDPLNGLQMSYNITVLPVLTAKDMKMSYKDGSKFEASLVDGTGKPLANEKITFNINGVFYTKTTDSNGIARLNINLMAGKYIITSQYGVATISNKITISA